MLQNYIYWWKLSVLQVKPQEQLKALVKHLANSGSCVCTLLKAVYSKCFRDIRKESKIIYLLLPSIAALWPSSEIWGQLSIKQIFLSLAPLHPLTFQEDAKFLIFIPPSKAPICIFRISAYFPSDIFHYSLYRSRQMDFQHQIFFPIAVKIKNKNFLISR